MSACAVARRFIALSNSQVTHLVIVFTAPPAYGQSCPGGVMTSKRKTKQKAISSKASKVSRRRFLAGAAASVGGAAVVGFPAIVKAEQTTFRFQSTWPTKDIFHEYALDYAKIV